LTGYDRFLARHFAGKKGLPNGGWPVNLVHRDDVVEAINRLVLEKKSGIYNICAPNHPSKKDFYINQCKKYGYELPEFTEDASTGKVVSTAKLLEETEFQYKFPDPFDFQYTM
jgi:nucleoside-diphosphate-sugar epimerase